VKLLQILDDCERLNDAGAIVEFEDGQAGKGVSREVLRGILFAPGQLDDARLEVDRRAARILLSAT
jgi:hypothetical protein